MRKETYYSNGKLLITGEYVVLDGALSLALPTKFGQSLIIEPIEEPKLLWKSYDEQGGIWFENKFSLDEINTSKSPHNDISKHLFDILFSAKQLNPNFLSSNSGFNITTNLDFSKNWGLGTSSTLINNIANWAQVDAFKLLHMTFGGSGYDIASAQNNHPITYQLLQRKHHIKKVDFNPVFKEHLYFVYLNKKQNSRDGIAQYKLNKKVSTNLIEDINTITSQIISCNILTDFDKLITTHETIISKVIKQKPIKETLFNDFNGAIKSLGAWGGDFILVTSTENPETYFKNKGFETMIPFCDMVL